MAVAAMIFLAGCSAAARPARPGHRSSGVTDVQSSAAVGAPSGTPPGPSGSTTLRHWGSFFGHTPGNVDTLASPASVTLPGTVAQIGTSNSTEYALLTDGRLYAWGLGTQGELGDGGLSNSLGAPVQVRFPAGVTIASIPADAMPFDTGLAVDTTGHVWGWGNNGGGQLCLGNTRMYTTPVRLPLSGVTAVAGASTHGLYDAAGTVYACGQNIDGDLGDGSWRSSTRPVQVATLNGRPVARLVAAFANSGALLANGKYFDWGYNGAGQLGHGTAGRASDVPVHVPLPHAVVKVAQGGSIWDNGQTLVKLSDGSLWSWGSNAGGQLGNGSLAASPVPVRFYAPPGVKYRSLATGSATSYAVSATGKVYAWGVSYEGQLGDGDLGPALVPVVIASGATFVSSTANNALIR
ncbi:MAG: RCC1 domain-containing protein [Streptosporangiaceae bacterium]